MPEPLHLVLASASPRRHELLRHLGVTFDVIVSGFDEASLAAEDPADLARDLALAKASEVAAEHSLRPVLAADTIVVLQGEVIGKPVDAAEARATLERLRGREHEVITGVALLLPGAAGPVREHVTSRVHMRRYTDEEISQSIANGTPFDKAGGYGVQDPHLRPVEHWQGCYCNVMGLPLLKVAGMLQSAAMECDLSALPAVCAACDYRRREA